MPKKSICLVSGARSDYGLLYPLAKRLQSHPSLNLQIVAAGSHFTRELGATYLNIEQDGLDIAARVEMLLSSDTPVGIAKSIGIGVMGFADVFDRLRPDILVLIGDRYETLAAAQAALVGRLPVAHINGGDTTVGAFDEAMRHSITKMSHLHFVTNEISARRVRQLGENPECIFNVGSLQIDCMLSTTLLTRQELEERLEFRLRDRNLLVTFHPVTLDKCFGSNQLDALLGALERLGDGIGILFTGPNADTAGRSFSERLMRFVDRRPSARVYASLGRQLYLSAMAHVDAVVGNSSSGIYEAPTLKKPTVNIGDRQRGRILARSVLSCAAEEESIFQAIQQALKLDCSDVVNPYGDGHSAERIIAVLERDFDRDVLVKKCFHDLAC